jgi:helicase MOV-10
VTIVEAIKQVVKLIPDAHIVAAAPSNAAADLLATRLMGRYWYHIQLLLTL